MLLLHEAKAVLQAVPIPVQSAAEPLVVSMGNHIERHVGLVFDL